MILLLAFAAFFASGQISALLPWESAVKAFLLDVYEISFLAASLVSVASTLTALVALASCRETRRDRYTYLLLCGATLFLVWVIVIPAIKSARQLVGQIERRPPSHHERAVEEHDDEGR